MIQCNKQCYYHIIYGLKRKSCHAIRYKPNNPQGVKGTFPVRARNASVRQSAGKHVCQKLINKYRLRRSKAIYYGLRTHLALLVYDIDRRECAAGVNYFFDTDSSKSNKYEEVFDLTGYTLLHLSTENSSEF